MTQTPAGWHPAPDRPGQVRYWDGQAWSDHYAPAAPPPPRQRGTGTRILIALGLMVVVGLAAYWFWPREADIPEIEAKIASDLEAQAGTSGVTVDCPESVRWEVGETFECTADDGVDSVTVVVRMTSDDGEWDYSVRP